MISAITWLIPLKATKLKFIVQGKGVFIFCDNPIGVVVS